MSRIKKTIAALLITAFMLSVSSCLGPISLEKYGYALTIGLDKGTRYKYNVSFLLESDTSNDGQEQSSNSKLNVISAEGDNIYSAIYTAESGLPVRLNFSRTNYIVINYDVAADNGIIDFFSTSWSMLKIRTSTNMIISQCTAYEFMSGLDYTQYVNVTKLESSLIDFYELDGLTSMMSVTDFLSSADDPYFDAVVPLGSVDNSTSSDSSSSYTTQGVPRKGGMISYTLGSALFSDSVLCGVLTGRENQLLLLMQGKLNGTMIQFTRTDGTNYTVKIGNSKKPLVKTKIKGDRVYMDYNIPISVVLVQESSSEMMSKMRKSGNLEKSMEKQITDFLKDSCTTIFANCRELNCDALGTGKYVCKEFSTAAEWEGFDYRSKYKNTECTFNVNIDIQDIFMSSYSE